MIGAFTLIVSLWLMFSLFLFAWLGPQRSARLWNEAVDHFHDAISASCVRAPRRIPGAGEKR